MDGGDVWRAAQEGAEGRMLLSAAVKINYSHAHAVGIMGTTVYGSLVWSEADSVCARS